MLLLFTFMVSISSVVPKSLDNDSQQLLESSAMSSVICNHTENINVVRILQSTPTGSLIGLLECTYPAGETVFQPVASPSELDIFNVTTDTGYIYLKDQSLLTRQFYSFEVHISINGSLAANITVEVYIDFFPPECSVTQLTINMADDQLSCNTSLVTCENPQGGFVNFTTESALFYVNDLVGGNFEICPATQLGSYVGLQKVVVYAANLIGRLAIVVEVTVLDTNNAPVFSSLQNYVIPENTTAGTVLDTIEATDVDSKPEFSDLIITIAGQAPAGTTRAFVLDDSDRLLVGNTPLNASYISEYRLTFMVTDEGQLSDVGYSNITILDVNDSPVCSQNSLSLVVDTRTSVGQTIATVNCWDYDTTTEFNTVLYELNGHEDGIFGIDQNGTLTVDQDIPLNWTSYDFQIKVFDQYMRNTNTSSDGFMIDVKIRPPCVPSCINGDCVDGVCVCYALHYGTQCENLETGAVVGFTVVAVGLTAAVGVLVSNVAFGFNPVTAILACAKPA